MFYSNEAGGTNEEEEEGERDEEERGEGLDGGKRETTPTNGALNERKASKVAQEIGLL